MVTALYLLGLSLVVFLGAFFFIYKSRKSGNDKSGNHSQAPTIAPPPMEQQVTSSPSPQYSAKGPSSPYRLLGSTPGCFIWSGARAWDSGSDFASLRSMWMQ
ncbi:hypothetical protein B0I35DRAFT_404754 [Stachybotrys elegans]|uniref:Uncharacterized protein n=1 Tax=Stachybotrys elegans TaxID=80388 RepID=A0A8K0WXT0_9HYPO|nr:hypothetical protein B0I35DRAFT_404754 [Stachybotrys elegans]